MPDDDVAVVVVVYVLCSLPPPPSVSFHEIEIGFERCPRSGSLAD